MTYMEFKTFKTNIDINLYILSSMCECSLLLNYPTYIREKIKSFKKELDDILFEFPKSIEDYDILDQKFICTTIFKKNDFNSDTINN